MKLHDTKEDREYLINVLKTYYYLKHKQKELKQDIIDLTAEADATRVYIKGKDYSNDTAVANDGCSVHYVSSTKPMNKAIVKLSEMNSELNQIDNHIVALDKFNHITERLNHCEIESQIIINNIYARGMTIKEAAELHNVSRQTISDRLNKALDEMITYRKFC